jgi:hypothetical protein
VKRAYVLKEVVVNQFAIAFGSDAPDDVQTQLVIDAIRTENRHFVLGRSNKDM